MTGRPRMSAANELPCVAEEPRRSSRIDRDGFIAQTRVLAPSSTNSRASNSFA
jgi:hypothetical protein